MICASNLSASQMNCNLDKNSCLFVYYVQFYAVIGIKSYKMNINKRN